MTKKEKNKKAKLKKLIVCFIILCLCISVFAIYNIVKWAIFNNNNNKIQEEIENMIHIEQVSKEENKDKSEEDNQEKYIVDFQKLKEKNSDVVAYIKVPNTQIDYVVVKGKDNSFYLKHNLEKARNSAGWIFADYKNKFDGTDKNIVIFGHNTRNGSMFGSLKNVLKKEWCENKENQNIILVTENGTNIYKVFSVYTIPAEDYYIKTSFSSDNEFNKFVKVLKSRSLYDFNTDVTENDNIITLSTCKVGGKDRVVLHAKKME